MESDENGQSKTKENDSPMKPSDRCQVKEAEGSISQSKDAQLKTHDQQLPPQMASKRTLEKCEPLIQQGADQRKFLSSRYSSKTQSPNFFFSDTNVPTVLETESSSAKCHENQFLTCRRKSEPAKSSEEDKDAEGSRRPKRPRYSSIHSFGTERSANNHTYYTRPCTQAGTREQTSVVKPTERVSENSNAGQETVPENVNTASSATVELSCQSGSKRRRPLSVWKLVQELSGHSRQLQKLGEDNERNYLNSFLSRLNRYRRSTL